MEQLFILFHFHIIESKPNQQKANHFIIEQECTPHPSECRKQAKKEAESGPCSGIEVSMTLTIFEIKLTSVGEPRSSQRVEKAVVHVSLTKNRQKKQIANHFLHQKLKGQSMIKGCRSVATSSRKGVLDYLAIIGRIMRSPDTCA